MSDNPISKQFKFVHELDSGSRGKYLIQVTLIENLIDEILGYHFCPDNKINREMLVATIVNELGFATKINNLLKNCNCNQGYNVVFLIIHVKKDERVFILGIVIGGVLFMFYEIFQIGITPYIVLPVEHASKVLVKAIAVGLSILVIITFYYLGIKHVIEDKKQRSTWDRFWNENE